MSGIVLGAEEHVAFVGGAGAGVEVDHDIGLGDGFLEVDISSLVGDAAIGFAGEEAADVFGIDAGAAFAELEAGAVDDRYADDIAADGGGIGLGDEIEDGDRADHLCAVDRALQHKRRSGLGAGDEMHGDIEPHAGTRLRGLEVAEDFLAGFRL